MATILLDGIYKTYSTFRGEFRLEDINLVIPDGKTTVLIGPSGCGKTTLLRIIAGLETPDEGVVRYDGVDMSNVPVGERNIGMVFQSYALYPHLTAIGNILSRYIFGPKRREDESISEEKLEHTSQLLGVKTSYLEGRRPWHLSQGERQRVALGRAITRDPELLLLDEPLSNLDAKLRVTYRTRIKRLIQELELTTVYVTHNQQEAMVLGDFIVVMNDGRIEQKGNYMNIYSHPKNAFVAGFLSMHDEAPAINLVEGANVADEYRNLTIGVRPEDIEISLIPSDEHNLQAKVLHVTYNPASKNLILNLALGQEQIFCFADPGPERVAAGQQVWLHFMKYHKFGKVSQKQ